MKCLKSNNNQQFASLSNSLIINRSALSSNLKVHRLFRSFKICLYPVLLLICAALAVAEQLIYIITIITVNIIIYSFGVYKLHILDFTGSIKLN